MATFEAQVEGQTGLSIDGSSSPTQTELTQFLKDGVIDVTNRCLSINPREANNFSRESAEQTSNGINVGSSKILSVVREDGNDGQWYPCRKESIGLQYKVTDTSSLHYASKYNPVYMITQNRNVHVYPAPSTSGNDTFKVLYVNYDPEESDGTDLQYDSTGIKWFPDDKVYLVILYASIKSLENSLSAKSLPDAITIPVLPSSVSLSSVSTSLPSFTEPSAFVPPASLADANVSFSEVGDFPAYVSPSFSAPTLGSVGSLTLPSVPVSPSLTSNSVSFSTTAPSYNEPVLSLTTFPTITWSFPSVPVAPSISAQTVADFSSSAPTYTQPVLSLGDAPTISDLSISVSVPVPPETASFTSPSIDTTTVSNLGVPPTYTAPTATGNAGLTGIEAGAVDDATDKIEFDTWWDVAGDLIESEEDIELAQAQMQKINSYIQAYSGAMQNKLNEFNDANAEYQGKLQEAIQQAQINAQRASQQTSITLQKENQEYGTKLQKYSNELQSYQQQVNKEVQEYQQNLDGDLRVWQAERQTDIQKFSADIQNAVNLFNKENVIYQATVQEKIQEAQLADSNEAKKLQKYQQEISSYGAEVNKVVNGNKSQIDEWQSRNAIEMQKYGSDIQNRLNTFNKENVEYQAQLQISIQNAQLSQADDGQKLQKYSSEVGLYQAEVNSKIQEWVNEEWNQNFLKYQNDYASLLKEYGTDIQSESERVKNDVQNYQQKVAKALQTYQAETGYDIAKLNANIQKESQRFTQDLAKQATSYKSDLEKYQAEAGKINQDNQSKIAKFSAEVQSFSSELANKVQEFNSRMQKSIADYGWMESRMKNLKEQYNSAFTIMAGTVQREQQPTAPPEQQRQQQQYRR